MGKPGVMFYFNMRPSSKLSDMERLQLYDAILDYGQTGEVPNFSGALGVAWDYIQPTLDEDSARYEATREKRAKAGALGGSAKAKAAKQDEANVANASDAKQKEANVANQANSIQYNSIQSNSVQLRESKADKPPTRPRFSPPSVEEVAAYCREKGYAVDAERFVDYSLLSVGSVEKPPSKTGRPLCEPGHGRTAQNPPPRRRIVGILWHRWKTHGRPLCGNRGSMMFDFSTAEYSMIGCVLIDARCFPTVREVLPTADAFASDKCRKAYEAACQLADAGKGIDPVTVGRVAGLDYDFLGQCMELAPTCTRAAEYAGAVLEGFQRRQLQALGEKLQAGALDTGNNTDRLLTEARSALDSLANTPGRCCVKSTRDSLASFLVFRAEVQEGKRQTVKTGFPSLDGILGGFAQGGLYVMAARPGVGKSALGIALADMMAKAHTVLYVSLEMTEDELNARRIAAFSDAPCTFGKLLFGKLSDDGNAAVVNTCGKLYEHHLRISAVPSLTVPELEIQARNVGAGVVIVDYLGLLSATDKRLSEYDRITQISGDLKRMAKRLHCVVLALCQLNRESVSGAGTDARPKLSQLRSSGAIEQDSDGVLLLHRPEYGQQEITRDAAAPQQFFVDVAKNRHGRTGTAELAWYAPVNRFEDRSGKWVVKSWA